jgi:hypothetical protein
MRWTEADEAASVRVDGGRCFRYFGSVLDGPRIRDSPVLRKSGNYHICYL